MIADIIGYLASFAGVIAFLPQVVKTIKTKSTKDISAWMFAIFCTSNTLWLIYGYLISSGPLVATNIIVLVCAGIILRYKLVYK